MSSSSKKDLFDDKDDLSENNDNKDDVTTTIRINKEYATQYQTRKELQELRQYKNDNDGGSSSSSSDESSEDEDGDLLTPTMDVTILKTINALRNKDESIYDVNTRFFPSDASASDEEHNSDDDNDDEEPSKNKKRRHKPLKYKDVVRQQILEQIKEQEDAEERGDGGTATSKQQQHKEEAMSKLEYDEEQRELRSAFINSTKDGENQDEDDWMVLKSKNKTVDDENDKIDKEANRLIHHELQVMEQTTRDDDSLVDPRGEVENGQEFLLDFLKNKKWIDKTDQQDSDSNDDDNEENKNSNNDDNIDNDDSDDDSIEQLDRTDDFEAKYNFRFEEAAAATTTSGADHSMISYARGNSHNAIPTLRRKDETRRLKRLQRKEKKALERQQKEEQLRRLKNAKRHEMQEKYKQIQSILDSSAQHALDEASMMKLLEGDYDAAQFEQAMNATYNDDFYQQDDTEWKSDEQVRESLLQDESDVFVGDNDDADGGLYDNYNDQDNDEEGDGNEYDEEQQQDNEHHGNEEEPWDDNDEYFGNNEEQQQQEVSETEQRLKQKMMDELYKLDYEDIVAGMPTRFKYRNVEANDYGLSTREVLFARDTTLKQFVSLKKMAPYREEGEYHVTGKKRRRFREMVKHEMEEEMVKEQEIVNEAEQEEQQQQPTKKKRRRQKKKGKKKEENDKNAVEKKEEPDGETTAEEKEDETETATGKRRRKKKGSKKKKTDVEKGEAETKPNTEPIKEEEEAIVPPLPTMESSSETKEQPPSETKEPNATKNSDKKKRKKKRRKKKSKVEGVSAARLAAYGL